MDTVFATAAAGKAYVFRHNFSGNKWENVTNRKDGTSVVSFRKRGDEFRVRIIPEGGEKASCVWTVLVILCWLCVWLAVCVAGCVWLAVCSYT